MKPINLAKSHPVKLDWIKWYDKFERTTTHFCNKFAANEAIHRFVDINMATFL